jgi:hypothetical protein
MTEQNTAQDSSEAGKLYAVYDETLQRFTGGTHATRSDANEAKSNGPKGHKLVVRAVDKR